MRRHPYTYYLLGAFFIMIGLAACSGEDCPINNTVQGKLAFYNYAGDAVVYTDTLTVSVVRPQGDSIVLNKKTKVSEVLFPLSYTHKTDTLILAYGSERGRDSLFIRHANTPTLVSIDCGIAMFHTITSVGSTRHWIDSLILTSSEVNYDKRENIQVIYH